MHHRSFGVSNLPFGKGERWAKSGTASKIAGGWELNWVLSAMSRMPFTITDTGAGASALNAPGNTQTVNLTGPVSILNGDAAQQLRDACKYFDITNLSQVTAAATLGNAGRDILFGPGLFALDASLFRNFKITERLTFQFQAEA